MFGVYVFSRGTDEEVAKYLIYKEDPDAVYDSYYTMLDYAENDLDVQPYEEMWVIDYEYDTIFKL